MIDEILLENLYRNKEGNPLILDTILLEKVSQEDNITLLLNTSVYEIEKINEQKIKAIHAFCSQNSTGDQLEAPLFCDASGDGIVGFLSGASFRKAVELTEVDSDSNLFQGTYIIPNNTSKGEAELSYAFAWHKKSDSLKIR